MKESLYLLIFKYPDGEEVCSEKPVSLAEARKAYLAKANDMCPNASSLIIQPTEGSDEFTLGE